MSDYSAVAPPPNFSQSVAFAAALQRAKQIAAKINPTNASNPDIKLKRSLEDSQEPDTKKLAVDPLLGLRQSGLGDSHGGRGLSQSSSPPQLGGGGGGGGSGGSGGGGLGGICNEDIRVPDKMVGLIIGRGGEQITRLQSETGCKIQMAPESGGLPDRVCTLTGSREAVNRAKERVLSIVNDRCRAEGLGETGMGGGSNSSGSIGGGSIGGGSGPMMSSGHGGGGGGGGGGSVEIMIPGPKVGLIIGKGGETIKQLQEKSGAKMIVIQDGPSLQEQEKPLRITGDPQKVEYAKNLVYELIAEKEMQMFQRGPRTNNERSSSFSSDNGFGHGGSGGGGGGGGGSSPDGVEVLVPRAAVGVVIGKGGDMIKKIQSETGARVQFQQGREEGPGDRKCLLSGKPQAVEQARQRIQELIDSRRDDRNPMGGGRGGGGGGSTGNGNGSRGNGFGGGAGRPNEYGGWDRRSSGGSMENKIETTYKVPSTKCGIIIGKGGETIKQINQQTGAHCELDRNNQEFENEKVFFIRGSPEQVEHAKRIFSEKLGGGGGGMGSSGGSYTPGGQGGPIGYNPTWNPNSGYQSWPNTGQQSDANNTAQSVQMNPQTGQPDYSAQWAEYYRSMGMHREAEMIEQQSKQAKTDQQPAPPGSAGAAAAAAQQQQQQQQQAQAQAQAQASQQGQQTAATQNGGQPDYSAQWAEYYRSIGKPKEAEAIEAQMKGGKMNMPSNQMAQPQMQQQQQQPGQPGNNSAAPGTPSPFPQAYGTYPGMNPGAPGYYPSGGGGGGGGSGSGGGSGGGGNSGSGNTPTQQQSGQQNPGFGGGMGYQNYPYSQQNSDN